jgi:hypothetical protein
MNEKPWWVYASQILILACGVAIIFMAGIDGTWQTADILPLHFRSPSLDYVVLGLGIFIFTLIIVRWALGRRSRFWESLFEFLFWW